MDSLVDITSQLRSAFKLPKDYFRLARFRNNLEKISNDLHTSPESLYKIGRGRGMSSFVHPLFLDDMSEWCGVILRPSNVDSLIPEELILESCTGYKNKHIPQAYIGLLDKTQWTDIKNTKTAASVHPKNHQQLLKFGNTITKARFDNHEASYGSFELIDTVKTMCPTLVESKLKTWLKDRSLLFEGKHENKTARDIELIVVSSQDEYNDIVMQAQEFADTFAQIGTSEMDYLCEMKKIREEKVALAKRRHEIEIKMADIAAQRVTLERLNLQAQMHKTDLSSTDAKTIPRYVPLSKLNDIMMDEQVAGDRPIRARGLWHVVKDVFRWTSVYDVILNSEKVLKWILANENEFTARNHLIGLDTIINLRHLQALMTEDLGVVEKERLVEIVDETAARYRSETNKVQVMKKTEQRSDHDRLGVSKQIPTDKINALRLADTILTVFKFSDISDIVKDPLKISDYIEKTYTAPTTKNKHSTGLMALMNTECLQNVGIESLGQAGFQGAKKIITERQQAARQAFNDFNRLRRAPLQ